MSKKVVLLGSTGSIGCSTLKVAHDLPEEIDIIALAANDNVAKLAEQARDTGVKHVAIYDATRREEPTVTGNQGKIRLAWVGF